MGLYDGNLRRYDMNARRDHVPYPEAGRRILRYSVPLDESEMAEPAGQIAQAAERAMEWIGRQPDVDWITLTFRFDVHPTQPFGLLLVWEVWTRK
jgi:hypothetical protein